MGWQPQLWPLWNLDYSGEKTALAAVEAIIRPWDIENLTPNNYNTLNKIRLNFYYINYRQDHQTSLSHTHWVGYTILYVISNVHYSVLSYILFSKCLFHYFSVVCYHDGGQCKLIIWLCTTCSGACRCTAVRTVHTMSAQTDPRFASQTFQQLIAMPLIMNLSVFWMPKSISAYK